MPSETSSDATLSANHVVSNASLFTDIVSIMLAYLLLQMLAICTLFMKC